MDRRNFLRAAVVGVGVAAVGGSLWRCGSPVERARPGASPYGPLQRPDVNGMQVPAGFTSRVIARSGQPVAGYRWHDAPDGGACYADGDGWIYVSNSEINEAGGASAVRFYPDGTINSAYRILDGTNRNCAGGATPWQTWLSCEEVDRGAVYETDPFGARTAVRRPAMGRFQHEAAACDPDRKVIYLTEDEPDGCFYRFTPAAWGDLSSGTLDVLTGDRTSAAGPVSWVPVPDPAAARVRTRFQVPAVKRFDGGEGCYYADGTCWFTTKGDNRVWAYRPDQQRIELTYDHAQTPDATLTGVDNITGSRSGDLYVAEDAGDMEINIISGDIVAPFLRLLNQRWSEITGPAFSPDGSRLYFSSQRGTTKLASGGITYEVSGPFRHTR